MDMTQLAPNLYVGPQISADDLEVLWNQGFTDVACNRPDAEHPDGATSGAMAAMARKLGFAFHYLPIAPGEPFDVQAEALSELVKKPGSKVFAYCRSGARSSKAWALARSNETNRRAPALS